MNRDETFPRSVVVEILARMELRRRVYAKDSIEDTPSHAGLTAVSRECEVYACREDLLGALALDAHDRGLILVEAQVRADEIREGGER